MPRRQDLFTLGNFYHVFNRALRGELLFQSLANFEYCISLQRKYAERYGIEIVAFCLMPNHYHYLVKQQGDATVSRFIGGIINAYIQAINKERNRKGPLFEGRFNHVWIDREECLLHLCRYIHLNPVKAGIVDRPSDWPFSDYSNWISSMVNSSWESSLPKTLFRTPAEYETYVTGKYENLETPDSLGRYLLD